MPRHSLVALVSPPIVGGLFSAALAFVDASSKLDLPSLIGNFAIWTLVAAAFEFAVLLPLSSRFRERANERVSVFLIGSVAWYLAIVLIWLFMLLEVPLLEALRMALPALVPGAAMAATFSMLWSGARHA